MTHTFKKYVCLSEVTVTVLSSVEPMDGSAVISKTKNYQGAVKTKRGEILKFSSMKKFPTSENFVILLFLENFELVCSTTNTSTYHYSRNLTHFNTPNQFYRPIYPVSIELMCRLTYAIFNLCILFFKK